MVHLLLSSTSLMIWLVAQGTAANEGDTLASFLESSMHRFFTTLVYKFLNGSEFQPENCVQIRCRTPQVDAH